MKLFKNFLVIILITFLLYSCSKKERVTILQEKDLNEQMIELYEEAYTEFLDGDDVDVDNSDDPGIIQDDITDGDELLPNLDDKDDQ